MNVLYSSSEFDQVQTNLKKNLEKKGVNVIGFSYYLRRNTKTIIKCDGITVSKCNSFFRGPLFYLSRIKKIARKYIDSIKETSIDLMIGNMLFTDGIIFHYINKHIKVPYVVAVRNTDLNLSFLWRLPWIRGKAFAIVKEAKAIICLSYSYKKNFIEKLPYEIQGIAERKIKVVPNGIDAFWFNCKDDRNKKRKPLSLITIGRIEKNKNQIMVAKAIENLKRQGFNLNYIIVGSIEDESIYDILSKKEWIKYYSYKPKEELREILNMSDIFIMPSFKESFGLVYAEAMSQGLPVIYTQNQGFDEQFEEGTIGFHVDPNDISDISKKIKMVINQYEELSKNASAFARKFDWSIIADEYIKLFKKILSDNEIKHK